MIDVYYVKSEKFGWDYTEQAEKLYSDLKAMGWSEEDIDNNIKEVGMFLFPCDDCEVHLGECVTYLFQYSVTADEFNEIAKKTFFGLHMTIEEAKKLTEDEIAECKSIGPSYESFFTKLERYLYYKLRKETTEKKEVTKQITTFGNEPFEG